MNLKKIGKLLTSKSVGTGPSSYDKIIYRAAVSQRLRKTVLNGFEIVPVAPIITGITFVFTFHMRCISIVRSLYYYYYYYYYFYYFALRHITTHYDTLWHIRHITTYYVNWLYLAKSCSLSLKRNLIIFTSDFFVIKPPSVCVLLYCSCLCTQVYCFSVLAYLCTQALKTVNCNELWYILIDWRVGPDL